MRRTTSSCASLPSLDLSSIDADAARRTRSIIMFLGPLLHRAGTFQLPYAGGCDLGTRTVEPHMSALRHFGLDVVATDHHYQATTSAVTGARRPIVLTERGRTVAPRMRCWRPPCTRARP